MTSLQGPATSNRTSVGQPAASGHHLSLRLIDDQVRLVASPPGPTADVTAVSCTTAERCRAVGVAGSHAFAASTGDGGRTWNRQALPPGLLTLSSLSCATNARCVAIGTGASGPVIVATTASAGWTEERVPAGVSTLSSVSCTTTAECWAVGDLRRGAALLHRSASGAWERRSAPVGVTGLTDVGCTTGTTATCLAVGTTDHGPAAIDSVDGRAWTTISTPPGAVALASAGCTNPTAPLCTTLAESGGVWTQNSFFLTAPDPAARQWRGPQGPGAGLTVPAGTVSAGIGTCLSFAGPPCTPPNGPIVNTVTRIIANLGSPGAAQPIDEALVLGYFASPPSTVPGHTSAVWYVGLAAHGLTAKVVLTPEERTEGGGVGGPGS